jgi:Uma2 family endonuclease
MQPARTEAAERGRHLPDEVEIYEAGEGADDLLANLPGEEDLPDSDGEPMESERHVYQMTLLIETLKAGWAERDDFHVAGNMFLYFDVEQTRGRYFRGPDVFVVLDVPKRERRSWIVWKEGKGPDVVIELLSPTTARVDRTVKKQVYQDQLRVAEYVLYDPFRYDLEGFRLRDGRYEPLSLDGGRLYLERLDLLLVPWEGTYQGLDIRWLRWARPDGSLLQLPGEAERERAEAERERAEAERERAEAERERAEAERERAEAERERAEQAEATATAERERAEALARRLAELEARLGGGPPAPNG